MRQILSRNLLLIDEEDNTMPEEWNKHMYGSTITFEDFVTCENEVVTVETLNEEDILESVGKVIERYKDHELTDELQTPSTSVSINKARRATMTVRSFIEQCSNMEDDACSQFIIKI